MNAIAAEVGLSNHAVEGALRRHGLTVVAFRMPAKRHVASLRAAQVAASLGYGQHRRLRQPAQGGRLDLAGDVRGSRATAILASPGRR